VHGGGLPCTLQEAVCPFAGSLQVKVLASSSRLPAIDQELIEQIQNTACGGWGNECHQQSKMFKAKLSKLLLVNNNYNSAMHAQGEQDVFLMRSMPHGDGCIEEQCRSTNSMRQRM